ncbi:MAG: hypothetical protein WEA31_00840 [Pirellulales bacterium]
MNEARVIVETGCRLHFGLLSLGKSPGRRFGGVGVMLAAPRLELHVSASEQFAVRGEQVARLEAAAAAFFQRHAIVERPNCLLELRAALPSHMGLGSGTQTALAVAAGLRRWLGMPAGDAAALATDGGRAQRSAIGTHGFLLGGLLLDEGRDDNDDVGLLGGRVAIPEPWHVVLMLPVGEPSGMHGPSESIAFDQLSAVEAVRRQKLMSIARKELLPAADLGDFDGFAEAVYQFGYEAGMCFAKLQGGPFATKAVAARIEWLRVHGVAGCGQSSWGPGIFAWTPSRTAAEDLASRVVCEDAFRTCDVHIAPARNQAAGVHRLTETIE